MKNFLPEISIVIPTYNVEKYIGECLESIFAQTFKNFEVIVVDDCSTDKTCEVIENFVAKQSRRGGALDIIKLKKNFGCPSEGRNIGIGLSRGKYIFFVDGDDVITKTALEEFYNLAEKFSADVVQTEKVFVTDSTEKISDIESCGISSSNVKKFVTEPTLMTEDFFQRAIDLQNFNFAWNVWLRFIRRDVLIKNQIFFPECTGEDLWFTCALVCSAKKYLRVPNINYCYRLLEGSLSHKSNQTPAEHFRQTLNAFDVGFGYLENFFDKQEFFTNNPGAKYFVFGTAVNWSLNFLIEEYKKNPAESFDEILREEFAKFKNFPAVAAFLFNRMNLFQIEFLKLHEQLKSLQK